MSEKPPPYDQVIARFTPPGESAEHPMPDPETQTRFCQELTEFRGIWHGQQAFFPVYGPKYGGGLGTYPYQTRPMAVYAEEVNKTFFCWGGTTKESDPYTRCFDFVQDALLQMVAVYDHTTGTVSKPVCVFDKWCAGPHDNPAIQIDPDGYLWLFSPSHGEWTTKSFIHRSLHPYEIREWVTISDQPLFAYAQPWVDREWGWMFLHTEYHHGRGLRIKKSRDGVTWDATESIADFGKGHYQVSWFDPNHRILATAFDMHPEEGGLDARTNLYFLQSVDGGMTWTTADGTPVLLPVLEPNASCRVHPYEEKGLLVYLRDVKYTHDGRPVILYVTSKGFEPGPENGPHTWWAAVWTGDAWSTREAFVSDNNYDHGELWVEEHEWRIIAPTGQGPQPWNPGGEVELWVSRDEGGTWRRIKTLRSESTHNHTFCRIPYKAHPDLTVFWADGDARKPSESRLYFCDADGAHVNRLVAGTGQPAARCSPADP